MNQALEMIQQARPFLFALTLVGAVVGCDRRDGNDLSDRREVAAEQREDAREVQEARTEAAASDADDTRKNVRDREPAAVTPFDQKENEVDRTITQTIRQGVVGAEGFSLDARNVKIITADGVVTLRGPVDNDQERMKIVEIAKKVEGVKRVDDQLEIARD